MASVFDSLNVLNEYRKNDPSLNEAESDVAAANLAYAKTGDERLKPIFESSTPVRWAGQIQQKASELGGEAEQAVTPWAGEIAGKTARNVISGLPGFIPDAITSVVPFGRFGKLATAAGSGIANYILEKATSGDNDAAMISGLTGAIMPSVVRKAGGAGGLRGAASAFGTGLAGGAAELGAKAYIAGEPGAKEQIEMLRTNPSEAAAFVLGQAGYAALPKVGEMATRKAGEVLARRKAEPFTMSDDELLLKNNVDFQNAPEDIKKGIANELKDGTLDSEQAQRQILARQAVTNPEAAKKLVEFDQLVKERDEFFARQKQETVLFNERELAATFGNQLDAFKMAKSAQSQAGLTDVPLENLVTIDPLGKMSSVTQNEQFNKALIDNGFGYMRQENDNKAFLALQEAKDVGSFVDIHGREFKLMAPKLARQLDAESQQMKTMAAQDLGLRFDASNDDVLKSLINKIEVSSKPEQKVIFDSLPVATLRYLKQFAIDYPRFNKATKLTDAINEQVERIDRSRAPIANMNRIDLQKAGQMIAQNGVGVQQSMDDPYLKHMAKQDRDLGEAVLQKYGDTSQFGNLVASAMGKMWAAPNMRNWFHVISGYKAKTAQEVKGMWSIFGDGSIDESQRMLKSILDNKQKASRVYDAILQDQANRRSEKPIAGDAELKKAGLTDDEIRIVRNSYKMTGALRTRAINSLREANQVDLAYLLNTQFGLDIPKARQAGKAIYGMIERIDEASPNYQTQIEAARNQIQMLIGKGTPGEVDAIGRYAMAKNKEVREYIGKFGPEGYMPMVRRGRWFVSAYKNKESWANAYDDKKKAMKAQEDLAKQGYIVSDLVDNHSEKGVFKGMSPEVSESFVRKNAADVQDALMKMMASAKDPEAIKGLIDDAVSRVNSLADITIDDLKSIKPNLKTKYLLERNGAAGFRKEDFMANLMDYTQAMLAKSNKNVARANARLERQNVRSQKAFYDSAMKDEEYAFNQKAFEFESLRKYASGMTLAGSMKYFLQNLAQPLVFGTSVMTQKTGRMFKSNEWFAKANALNAKWLTTGTTGNKNLDLLMKRADGENLFMSGELERLLSAKDITDGQIEAQDYFNTGRINAVGKGAKSFIKTLNRWMLSVGEAADVVNRRTSALMEFQRSLEKVGNRDLSEDEVSRMVEDARQFILDVNFTGDKAARPGAIKEFDVGGPAGIVHAGLVNATTLMNFVTNGLTQLAVFAKQAYKQSGGGAGGLARMWTTPYGKAVLSHMMYTAGLSGALGMLPFSQDIINILESTDKDLKINKALRQTIVDGLKGTGSLMGSEWLQSDPVVNDFANAVMGGAPAYFGADTSMSLGYGSILNYNSNDTAASQALGVTGDLIARQAQALSMLAKEGVDRMSLNKYLRMSAPKAVSQFMRIADMANSNQYLTSEGKPVLYEDMGAGSQFAVMAGFVPIQVTNQRSLDAWNKRDMDVLNSQRQMAVKKIAGHMNAARLTGDTSQLDKARVLFNEYMAANPDAEPSGLVNAIAKEQQSYINKTVPMPGLKESMAHTGNLQAFPGMQIPIQGKAPQAMQQANTAWAMGQPQVAQQRMKNMNSKMQSDAIMKAGIAPAMESQMQKFNKPNAFGNPQDMARMGALSELGQNMYDVK